MSYINDGFSYVFDSGDYIEVWGRSSNAYEESVFKYQQDNSGLKTYGVQFSHDDFNNLVVDYVEKKYDIDLEEVSRGRGCE